MIFTKEEACTIVVCMVGMDTQKMRQPLFLLKVRERLKKIIEFSIKGLTNPLTTQLIENHGRLMAVVGGSSGWVGSYGC